MRSKYLFFAALVTVALTVSACGSQAPSSAQAAPASLPTQAPPTEAPATVPSATQSTSAGSAYGNASSQPSPAAAASGPAMVNIAKSDQLGSYLVDAKGMALYAFLKDSPGATTCYGKCATAWPPLLTSGNAVAGAGVDAGKFGVTARTDGSTQVTYNGWPLYYFAKDKQPGDTTGQGVGTVWYLVSPTGDPIK